MLRRLTEIREELLIGNSPYGRCIDASNYVKGQLGFESFDGKFLLNGVSHYHGWNETSKGEIVDLTAGQFSSEFPEVLVVSRNSELARKYYLKS